MKEYFRSADEIHDAVMEVGFLPFFKNEVEGFSIREHTPNELWFTDEPGPWEWKGPVLRMGDCVYGKFFNNKAGFISKKWYLEFSNYRRDGYDFDSRIDDGIRVDMVDINIYEELSKYNSILSKGIRKRCGYWGKEGKSGFDTIMTRLQMQGYAITCDFEYELDKHGKPYGWGLARYSTPEKFLGEYFTSQVYRHEPEESFDQMLRQIRKYYPEASGKALGKVLGYKAK